ncbi:hypothetical protein CF326_g6912 [Tilletia indica]|nr:hypothetical protein CF326_g6912 [Tilletia indica]
MLSIAKALAGAEALSAITSSLDPVAVWSSLSSSNEPTVPLTEDSADSLPNRSSICLELSPAKHLVQQAFGTTDMNIIRPIRHLRFSSVAKSTSSGYGSNVVSFLRWCDDIDIAPFLRFPTPANVLLLFVASTLQNYRKSTMEKRIAGLRFWHDVHGLPWALEPSTLRRIRGSFNYLCIPPLPARDPVRPQDLREIKARLNFQDRAHLAVWAWTLFGFWSMARSGEISVSSVSRPHRHRPLGGHWTYWPPATPEAYATLQLHLPADKTHFAQGFDRIVSEQPASGLCPVEACRHHFHANGISYDAGAFSYIDRYGRRREMSKKFAMDTINAALKDANRQEVQGHALRIGGATAYIANNVSIPDVKRIGGWESDQMLIYIRDVHALHSSRFANIQLQHFAREPIASAPAVHAAP